MNPKVILGKSGLKVFIEKYLIIIGILIMMVYTCIVEPRFYSLDNILSLISQFVPLGLCSIGMTVVIISGYIDLSVAGIFSMMGIVACLFMNRFGAIGFVAALVVGAVCGLLDAAVINWCGARDDSEALFITFGMQAAFAALALIINGGNIVTLNQTGFTKFIGKATFLNIPVMMWIFVVLILIMAVIMKKTSMGRKIYYAGANSEATRLTGVKIEQIIVLVYVVLGILAALAAMIQACRVGSAIPTAGRNYENNSIMSVAVGGTSLAGGKGSVQNTILGVALVTIMTNALNILGIDSNMQNVWKGVILVAAIWLDSRRNSSEGSK